MKSTMILAAWLLCELVQWRECGELGLPVHPLGQMAPVCSEMQIIWVTSWWQLLVLRKSPGWPPEHPLGRSSVNVRSVIERRC